MNERRSLNFQQDFCFTPSWICKPFMKQTEKVFIRLCSTFDSVSGKVILITSELFSLCIKYESSDKWLPVADSKRFSNHGQRVNESSQLLWPISWKSVPVCWQKQLSFVEKLLCTRHRARLMGWREERQSYPRKANLMKKTDKEINNLDIDKPCSS